MEGVEHVVTRARLVVVGAARRALLVAVLAVGGIEDAVPRAMPVVDEVLPAVRPDPVVPVPVAAFAGAHGEQRRGGDAFGLDPEVFVAVADRPLVVLGVAVEAVDEAAVTAVPAMLGRSGEELAGAVQPPVGGAAVV